MASHYQHRHSHICHHQASPPPPPPPPPSTIHCCCNPSHQCCPSPPTPASTDQLLQTIASLLGQSDPLPTHIFTNCPQFETHKLLDENQYLKFSSRNRVRRQEQHAHSAIVSLLCRIEALESSLHRFSSSHSYHQSSYYSLRHAAARVIQTHFRAFLVRRSRTLRQLKELGFIKSSFNSLKSSFLNDTHTDFAALSRKAMDLLLQLDSIEGDDPMIRDGKGSISRDLLHFLDSLEEVAMKKHLRLVKTTKNARLGHNINKPRVLKSNHGNLGYHQRKLLENLRGRVEKISRLCKFSANDDEDAKSERILHVADDHDDDDDGGPSIVISRKNGVTPTKNGVFAQRHEVQLQPKVKKSVSFAESGNVSKIYCNTYEPSLSEDVTCLDGNSSSDEQEEVLEDIRNEVEDVMDSFRGAEDDEEAMPENGGSAHNSDGERNSRRHLKKDVKNEGKLVFSAPLPLKMETRDDLMKSKGVRILT